MTFGRFISGKCNSAVAIKAIWPEKNRTVIGRAMEFVTEPAILAANVFDFMIDNYDDVGYNVIVWLTKSNDTMFDI